MQIKSIAAVVLGLAAGRALGAQLWHDVNRYDAHGNECKLREMTGIACSRLCVQTLDSCPSSLQPSCPTGQQFCADGQCHSECTADMQAQNPCHCSRSGKKLPAPAVDLIPCAASPSNITINEFHPWSSKVDIRNACGQTVGIDDQAATVGVWGSVWAGGSVTGVWAECPPAPAPNYRYDESYWVATYAVNGALALLIGVWTAFKAFAERKVRSVGRALKSEAKGGADKFLDKCSTSSVSEKEQTADKEAAAAAAAEAAADASMGDIRLRGYRSHVLGTACVWGIALVAVLWMCFLGVWTADYYGALPGRRHGVAYSLALESDFLELATFLILWAICFVLLVALFVVKRRLRNYFRVQTLPAQGQYVCVERTLRSIKMLTDRASWVQRQVNRMTEALVAALGQDREYTTCAVRQTTQGRRFFTYQCTRYVYDAQTQQYAPFEFDVGGSHGALVAQAGGLSAHEAAFRLELVGPNFISVEVVGVLAAFAREFSSFFYIYQLIFLWAYYFYAYYQVGLVDTGIILLSAGIKVALRMQSERRLKRMAEQAEDVDVLRDGAWARVSTVELVPGDVVGVAAGAHMACDCVLLAGAAVMDESSLTGEPLPVRKIGLADSGSGAGTPYDAVGSKASTLYAGTVVAQAQAQAGAAPDGGKPAAAAAADAAVALVRRTGTQSDKGQLVRQMLFPHPVSFVFDEQMRIVVAVLVAYCVFVSGLATYLYQGSSVAVAFYMLFLMSQACSPLLPASMVIGQSVAAARLRRKHIYCVDPQRIMTAGKVQVFCFDKTGTLTRAGLDFYGVQPGGGADGAAMAPMVHAVAGAPRLLQMAVAACHAVTDLAGAPVGNPVDVEQFRASGARIEPQSRFVDTIRLGAACTLHVVRRFEFAHARASMSVAVQDAATQQLHVFVKGSFERIRAVSQPASLPRDYDAVCAALAREGCYVLAVAHRAFDGPAEQLCALPQDAVEAGCRFAGLLVFRNSLKPDAADAVAELKRGATRAVMVTGDNALTGVFVARACAMLPAGARVLLGESASPAGPVRWTDVDSGRPVDDILAALADTGADGFPRAELAVGGAAFAHLCATGQIDRLLLHVRVFARMRPADKVTCVQLHMRHAVTAMCGDGGNDCGALRAAHVGLALSDAEASIVAPFSSSDRRVGTCVELLRESRAGLATSFANFAALICYGQVMSGMLKMASFYFAISLTQNLWMLIDGAVATGLALTLALAGPAERLAGHRPTARILGPQMLAAVGGTVLINWLFAALAYVWLFAQPWFRCNEHSSAEVDLNKWWLLGDNYEASVISFISAFQFINNGFLFNYGYVHRAAWFRNYTLLVVWAFLMIFVSYMLLADPNRVGCAFRLNCGSADVLVALGYKRPTWGIEPYNSPLGHNVFPRASRWAFWGYCLGNMLATNLWQLLVVNGPVRTLLRRKRPLQRLKVKL
ncbi:hypothetical protein LPJ53_003510 [Coemansia erecta]|uniref:P-type ATPase A domain-containing protein n=1 Tax=Coemansia erecta TaxID=147472 RepID=A0A9W7Y164_9FUNG|nr:hypothetical protein LPJ53_003510 [Coemansia erecta]